MFRHFSPFSHSLFCSVGRRGVTQDAPAAPPVHLLAVAHEAPPGEVVQEPVRLREGVDLLQRLAPQLRESRLTVVAAVLVLGTRREAAPLLGLRTVAVVR